MMLAPSGIVLGPGRIKLWWTRIMDWFERRNAPQMPALRAKTPQQNERLTHLEDLIDRIFK